MEALVVWDPNFFGLQNGSRTFEIKAVNRSSSGALDPEFQTDISTNTGYVTVKMEEEWLHGDDRRNLTVDIVAADSSHSSELGAVGPRISLLHKESAHHPNDPKDERVGMGVGIPLGLAFVGFIVVAAFFCMRRRRARGGALANRSQNRRSRGLHLRDDDDWTSGTRGAPERFRDEPTRGVELQDRTRGRHSGDSLGSLAGSPTDDRLGDRGRVGANNVFRDEISRQKGKNA